MPGMACVATTFVGQAHFVQVRARVTWPACNASVVDT